MDGEDIIIQNPMKSSQNLTKQLVAERAISDGTTICGSESKIGLKKSIFQLKNDNAKKGNTINKNNRYSCDPEIWLDKVPRVWTILTASEPQ